MYSCRALVCGAAPPSPLRQRMPAQLHRWWRMTINIPTERAATCCVICPSPQAPSPKVTLSPCLLITCEAIGLTADWLLPTARCCKEVCLVICTLSPNDLSERLNDMYAIAERPIGAAERHVHYR